MLFGEPSPGPASGDRSHIDTGLMERKGARASLSAVVIAHHRHGSREVKRFAEALKRAHGDKLPKLRAPAGGHRDEAPEKAAAQDEVLAAKPIADKPSERRAESID